MHFKFSTKQILTEGKGVKGRQFKQNLNICDKIFDEHTMHAQTTPISCRFETTFDYFFVLSEHLSKKFKSQHGINTAPVRLQ